MVELVGRARDRLDVVLVADVRRGATAGSTPSFPLPKSWKPSRADLRARRRGLRALAGRRPDGCGRHVRAKARVPACERTPGSVPLESTPPRRRDDERRPATRPHPRRRVDAARLGRALGPATAASRACLKRLDEAIDAAAIARPPHGRRRSRPSRGRRPARLPRRHLRPRARRWDRRRQVEPPERPRRHARSARRRRAGRRPRRPSPGSPRGRTTTWRRSSTGSDRSRRRSRAR